MCVCGCWFSKRVQAHREAARMFRLLAGSAEEENEVRQFRMLARHHDLRSHACDDNEAAKNVIKTSAEGLGDNNSFFADLVSPTAQEASTVLEQVAEEERWDLWKPVDNLLDKLFPADLFGDKEVVEKPSNNFKELICDNVEEGGQKKVLDSFMVVNDYQRDQEEVILTKKEHNVLEEVVRGKSAENEALKGLISKLHTQNEALTTANRKLGKRVQELEKEKKQMKEKVVLFREEVEKSFINGNSMFEGLLQPPPTTTLLRSRSPPNRSPSPDIHEYIRSLERKVMRLFVSDRFTQFYVYFTFLCT